MRSGAERLKLHGEETASVRSSRVRPAARMLLPRVHEPDKRSIRVQVPVGRRKPSHSPAGLRVAELALALPLGFLVAPLNGRVIDGSSRKPVASLSASVASVRRIGEPLSSRMSRPVARATTSNGVALRA